ncbi:MAG: DUF1524 domain-containing protein [Streptococcaceae bacterium]|nr:DUF1524 domain-containing protein [Streptococcaceae bacterium]
MDSPNRDKCISTLDSAISLLQSITLSSKSKPDLEFFKMYLRGHFATSFEQSRAKESTVDSDFVRIGKEFHRWVSDNDKKLGLNTSKDYEEFINQIAYFAKIYHKLNELIASRNTNDFLYLIVNSDFGFSLQPALLLSVINYQDSQEIVEKKIALVSKYLTKVLAWRVWNHWVTSQSAMESRIYNLIQEIRGKSLEEISQILTTYQIDGDISIDTNTPSLNQQNRPKLRVLLALITEIIGRNSHESGYLLNITDKKNPIEVEHIWSVNDENKEKYEQEAGFQAVRKNIGGLLLLPKKFNASYNDATYSTKVEQYFSQNILAQTLNPRKYEHSPGFVSFMNDSNLEFKAYEVFDEKSINERADLYRQVLKWNWEEK